MGNTYYITGVQIGILEAFIKTNQSHDALILLKEIQDKQLTTEEARKK